MSAIPPAAPAKPVEMELTIEAMINSPTYYKAHKSQPICSVQEGFPAPKRTRRHEPEHIRIVMDNIDQMEGNVPASPELQRCFSPTVFSNNLATCPRDVLEHLCHFLSFTNINSLSFSCRRLKRILLDDHVFVRIARVRWGTDSGHDRGTGPLSVLDLSRLPGVQHCCLAREMMFKRVTQRENAFKLTFDEQECKEISIEAERRTFYESSLSRLINLSDTELKHWPTLQQALRIMVELFDDPSDAVIVKALGSVEVPPRFARLLLLTIAQNFRQQELLTMGIKTLGLLSHNEHNRQLFPSLGAVELLVSSIENFEWEKVLLQNALWALVIIARPLGSFEGSPYVHSNDQSIRNVAEIMRGGGISAVLNTIKHHYEDPEILSKAFWCLVNLALINANKDEIIEKGGLEYIIDRMLTFPLHHEVQHRGCFALINLSIPGNIKDRIRELGGIQAVIAALRNFPNSLSLVRCACNVLISLVWECPPNRATAVNNGAIEVLQHVNKCLMEVEANANNPGHQAAITLVTTALQFI